MIRKLSYFKVCDAKNREINYYNTHIAKYLYKQRKPENYIWSVLEHNMRNIFLEKSYKKCDGETCPRSSSKKTKLSTSLDQHAKVLQFAFTVCPSQGLLTYILKLRCRSLVFYLIKKLFLKKQQQRFGQDTLPHFLYDSWKNIFLTLYSIN